MVLYRLLLVLISAPRVSLSSHSSWGCASSFISLKAGFGSSSPVLGSSWAAVTLLCSSISAQYGKTVLHGKNYQLAKLHLGMYKNVHLHQEQICCQWEQLSTELFLPTYPALPPCSSQRELQASSVPALDWQRAQGSGLSFGERWELS